MNCPRCQGRTTHNAMFSWQQGKAEVRNCKVCGLMFEVSQIVREIIPKPSPSGLPWALFPPRSFDNRYRFVRETEVRIQSLTHKPIYKADPRRLGIHYIGWLNAIAANNGSFLLWV